MDGARTRSAWRGDLTSQQCSRRRRPRGHRPPRASPARQPGRSLTAPHGRGAPRPAAFARSLLPARQRTCARPPRVTAGRGLWHAQKSLYPLPAPPPQGLFGLVGDLALAGRPSDHTARSLSGGDSSIEFEVGWSPVNIRLTPRAPAKTPYTGTKQFFFQA